MKGMVEKMMMFSIISVMTIGGGAAYNMMAPEDAALSFDDLANLVNWDEIAGVIAAILGGS